MSEGMVVRRRNSERKGRVMWKMLCACILLIFLFSLFFLLFFCNDFCGPITAEGGCYYFITDVPRRGGSGIRMETVVF